MTAADIARALPKGRKSGAGYVACCPVHEDHEPSLSLRDADGKVLVHCHAGCPQDAVIAKLKDLGLWPEPEQQAKTKPLVIAEYNYTDAGGNVLYQVCRTTPKGFFQRLPDGAGGWLKRGPKDKDKVLYRIREVLESPIVFLPEGEKDCERLRDHGFVATCEPGGANSRWFPQYTEALTDRSVIICPDNDRPGWERAKRIAKALLGKAAEIIVLDDIHHSGVKDISDWFDAGHSECELLNIIESSFVDQLPGGPI
jgi:putative DNA primase/helicase